jgi:hypothetical protein
MNPRASKHLEDIKFEKVNQSINLKSVHFAGSCRIIISRCAVQKNIKTDDPFQSLYRQLQTQTLDNLVAINRTCWRLLVFPRQILPS